MKKKMVSYTLETLPPISEERWTEMKALASRPDHEIDTSDIPVLTREDMKNAVRGYVDGKFQHPGLRKKQAA